MLVANNLLITKFYTTVPFLSSVSMVIVDGDPVSLPLSPDSLPPAQRERGREGGRER